MSSSSPSLPSRLDWLLHEDVKSYQGSGSPNNSRQVNPFMFRKTLAKLAEEMGAANVFMSATKLNYRDGGKSIESVAYTKGGTSNNVTATDVVLAAGT